VGGGGAAAHRRLERSATAGAHEVVRVLAVGQEQEARVLAVGQDRKRVLERPPGGLAAGRIAVEAEDHRIGEPEELLDMDRRGRRAERGHGVFDAVLGQGDHVHVALDHHDPAGVPDRVACKIEAVELTSLGEDGSFRGVEVLGLALAEHTTAETDHPAAAVVNGKHDPVAETVVALAVAGDHEAGGFQRRIVVGGHVPGQRLPAVGRIADAEAGRDRAGQAAALEVLDRLGRVAQRAAIELGRGQEKAGQIARLLTPLGFARPLDARHGEPHVAREILDRLGERLAGVLHEEAERRAVRPAAEAVIELLGRAHREGRRLLAVEGAAGLVVRARLLERDEPIDHLDDVDPPEQRLDEVVRNHRGGSACARDAARGRRTDRAGRFTRQGTIEL
jgi:hypothetical protein